MRANRSGMFATMVEALIAFAAVALFVSVIRAEPPTFTVVNRMNEFTVVNKCQPCSLCGSCECSSCNCDILQKRLAEAKAKPFAKPVQMSKVAFVQPKQGAHTHTCENPECPFTTTGYKNTWSHEQNKSHLCQYCSSEQLVADSPARMVTTPTIAVAKAAPRAAPQPFTRTTTVTYAAPLNRVFNFRGAGGGCANGNCAIAR